MLHGNLPITRGFRFSIVFFIHSTFFHHLRDFTKVYEDHKNKIDRDSHGVVVLTTIPQQDLNDAQNLNKRIRLKKPKAEQIQVPPASKDQRRKNIGK